jgi:hypothetical protein
MTRFKFRIFAFAWVMGSMNFFGSSHQAMAAPTYGAEFNFRCIRVAGAVRNYKVSGSEQSCVDEFLEKLKKKCPDCLIEEHAGKWGFPEYKVTHPKYNWGFNVSVDPQVLEIQSMPQTLQEIRETKKLTQKYIFDIGQSIGQIDEVSHFNIGVRAGFQDSPKTLLKYYSEYASRPALSMGVFGQDSGSVPLAKLKAAQKNSFEAMVVDANHRTDYPLKEFGKKINEQVHTWTPSDAPAKSEADQIANQRHYQALGMKNLDSPKFQGAESVEVPFEVRPLRHFKDAESYELFAEMTDKRIDYLKTQTEPIVFLNRKLAAWEGAGDASLKSVFLNGKLYDLGQAYTVHAYFSEMGEPVEKYFSLLNGEIRNTFRDGDLDRLFNHLDWSKSLDRQFFEEVVTRDACLSPWLRNKFVQMMVINHAPPEVVAKALKSLQAQAKESITARESIQKIYELIHQEPSLHAAKLTERLETLIHPETKTSGCAVNFIRSVFGK